MPKDLSHFFYKMDYGDTTDGGLAIFFGGLLLTCGFTCVLTTLFPCSCRPRRDCRRNCSDCARDRQKCRQRWYDLLKRERADTEEELISPI
jgi:hypothetical protein